jgi:hypothetical protein
MTLPHGPFGGDTVTFVTITDGVKDRLGIPAKVRTEVAVTGCRFRSWFFEEKVTLTDIATQMWKCTAPPDPAVLAAEAIDEVKHAGITYDIVGGVKLFPYAESDQIYKVTVLCKKQERISP